MNNLRSLLLLAAVSPAVIILSSCAKKDTVQTAVAKTEAAAKDVVAEVKSAAVESWDAVKDYSFEKRAEFSANLDRLAAKHDADVAESNAKVKGLPESAAKERDRANKEFAAARASLKTAISELGDATTESWAAARSKAVEAWQRTQIAYEKLKASATS